MSRNGQYGQGRPQQRRHPGEQDPYANGQGQGQWSPQSGYPDSQFPQNGYGNGQQPQNGNGGFAAQQGYHYPQSAEPEPQYYPQQPQGQGGYPPAQNGYQPHNNGYQPQQAQWGPQDPGNYDPGSYPQTGTPGGFGPAAPQHYPQTAEPAPFSPGARGGFAEPETDYDEVLADEEEHGSGRRWMLIVAALVGAICLGGGLAYTYKMLFTSGRAPIARPIEFPNKQKAGKENAQQEKKLFTRLGDEAPGAKAEEPEAASDDKQADGGVGGPRPVRIIPIVPNSQQGGGQVTVTGPVVPTKPAGGQMVVPGLMIDTGGGRGAYPQGGGMPGGGQARALPPQQITGVEPVAPQKKTPPVVVSSTQNTTTSSTGITADPLTPTAAPRLPVPKAKETASVGGAPNVPVSSGYVVVLTSQKTRMDAMKAYASIDQKYRDMLATSTFDVQEADLGEKGVWYRAVVGPPRSLDGAKKICEDLKAAGYPSCWPARY